MTYLTRCSTQLLVGEPGIQKLKKVAGKKQNFRLYPQLVWCFRSVKTDIAQILSLAKDVYLWVNHSYPHAGFIVGYLLHYSKEKLCRPDKSHFLLSANCLTVTEISATNYQ